MPNFVRDWIRNLAESISGPLESDSVRQYRVQSRDRPQLDDDAFYRTFYDGTGIRRDIPVRLRKLYEKITGDRLAGLHPDDNHAVIYDDLDFGDVLYRVGREFKVKIPNELVVKYPLSYRGKSHFDSPTYGTFDSVVRCIHEVVGDIT